MKKKKTNVHRILDQAKVPYTIHEYEWQEHKQSAGTAELKEKIFKTLLAVGDKTGPLVACINAEDELNLKALAKLSGNKKVEMLPMKELQQTTGYIRGGCSPIGMKKSFPTYVDVKAKDLETMIVSAGKRGHQVELLPDDLIEVVQGSYGDIRQK